MTLSVIIPVLNEEAALPAVLQALHGDPDVTEVIVVDGGSTDTTVQVAETFNVRVILASRGRGQQLVAGIRAARGRVLWFLHADTIPHPGASQALLAALRDNPDAPGGNFAIRFDGGSGFAEWLTGFYACLRSHGMYYGDSGIFVRRSVHDRIGGIRATALMEDYDFIRRLEKAGPTLNLDDPQLTTSSRRFQGRRPWRIFLQWVVIHAMYYGRISGESMARVYRSEHHSPATPRRLR